MAGSEEIILGVIPVGSGNDFSFSLGIPPDIFKACDVILNGKIRKIDLAKMNERFFVSSAGVGLDGETAYETNKNPSLTGPFLYLFSLFKVLKEASPHNFTFTFDGKKGKKKGWL